MMRDDKMWRKKSYSRALVSALAIDGGLDDEAMELMDELLETWWEHLAKNKLRRRYYEGENMLKDLGISIPPALRSIETVVGWPKKAVSALSSRIRFDGFTAKDEEVSKELARVVKTSCLKRKHRQAVESELISGCDFVTLSRGRAGEPPVIITTHSAEDSAAVWDQRLGRIARGLVIMDYDETSGAPVELALYTATRTVHAYVDEDGAVGYESMPHKMGQPMMVALAYNPTEAEPLGQSRISKAVRSLTDSAVRESLRTEISAEFFTSPQKYLLGTDGDPFEQKTKWEAYIGNIFNIDMNDDGSVPQFGQLSQGSMQPHTDYMRALAMRFSGETNVPVSQLGVIHDNPSSAEAIYAANEPLIIEAQTLIDDNSDAMVLVAQMALATSRGVALSELTEDELDILPHFKSPAMPSVVSQADAMVKIAAVVPKFPGTSVFWEMLGFSEDMRNRTKSEMEAGDNREALIAIMGGGQAGADESPRG